MYTYEYIIKLFLGKKKKNKKEMNKHVYIQNKFK